MTKSSHEDLFRDARNLQKIAIEELASGSIRDAAEKAWNATLMAINGLILARTGEEPSNVRLTTIAIEKKGIRIQLWILSG